MSSTQLVARTGAGTGLMRRINDCFSSDDKIPNQTIPAYISKPEATVVTKPVHELLHPRRCNAKSQAAYGNDSTQGFTQECQ